MTLNFLVFFWTVFLCIEAIFYTYMRHPAAIFYRERDTFHVFFFLVVAVITYDRMVCVWARGKNISSKFSYTIFTTLLINTKKKKNYLVFISFVSLYSRLELFMFFFMFQKNTIKFVWSLVSWFCLVL